MKTRTWILLFLALALVCVAAAALLSRTATGETAEIYSDGQLLTTVDLGRDDTFTITVDGGENQVVIADGKIYVSTATCPDQICVDHGPAAAGSPVVCLPNRLVISLTGGDVDAATGS
jgi:hypothetical protein